MQGRQAMANAERKGPHKSMHCKFCKPPGVVTPEKSTRPQMETKTKIHLVHEGADLRLCDIHDEPGFPAVESEACVCILEGENPCPKCVPDKNWSPPKKKVCRCPKGAKPHPSMNDGVLPKKVKQKEEDDEFWWEKYSREHDANAKETWAAYLAQRRKEKKLLKCQKREQDAEFLKKNKGCPDWYQKLSCQQMLYVEFLSTAIRLDSDENITDRTLFVLGGIGLYPRPKRKIVKKCLRFCHYNAIQFLNQLHLLTKDDDPFNEKIIPVKNPLGLLFYSWNEKLIMSSMCHLEFPNLLREVMDRLPPLPRDKILPQIPYPVFPKLPKKKYDNPYEEPIWKDRLNWVEKNKIDRLNRCRAHMDTKRVKIPPLALVRRPSLIDARPPFLNQIEANERASRRLVKEKVKKPVRKHPISTFNSAVDVTAIAGIEASEISTTDKADSDEICVFLREPLKPEMEEEEESVPEKEVRFIQEEPENITTEVNRFCLQSLSELGDECSDVEDMPFKTPPKTESGATIEQPCPPPDTSPGPPAIHYEKAKRELDIINKELCGFEPFVSTSTQTVKQDDLDQEEDNITYQLLCAAEKLKEFADEGEDTKDGDKTKKKKGKKSRKRSKCKRRLKKRCKKLKKTKKPKQIVVTDGNDEMSQEKKEEEEEHEEDDEDENQEIFDPTNFEIRETRIKKQSISQRESEISDPDPDTDDEWSARGPCTPDVEEIVKKPPKKRLKKRRKSRKKKTKKTQSKEIKPEAKVIELEEESGVYMKKKMEVIKEDKETMTECYPGQYDYLYKQDRKPEKEEEKKGEDEVSVFKGNIDSLLESIFQDLAEEGFVTAAYPQAHKHPDVEQLILYLKGEVIDKENRDYLNLVTKSRWAKSKPLKKFPIPELKISSAKAASATWNDKKWITRLAKAKIDEFYFKVAKDRAESGKQVYATLFQSHFGTSRYLKIFYAYMISKYEDCILRGVV